jgi:hypothetical protein
VSKELSLPLATSARPIPWLRASGIVILGSAFAAVCAHVSVPLFFTPVPLSLAPFAVLLLGLLLTPRLAVATFAVYLAEGAMGLPVFAPIDISIAHSPDSDDAFMFYGLATNKVRVPGYRFTHTLCDIETLNQRARERSLLRRHRHQLPRLPLPAGELHADGLRRQRGRGLRPHGRLQQAAHAAEDLGRIKIAVPGTLTTAYLALKIFNPASRPSPSPSTRSFPRFSPATSTPASSSTRASSPTPPAASTRFSTSASGGAKPPAWSCPWAATPSAARWARTPCASSPRPARQHPARPRPPRAGPRIRHAVCPRPRCPPRQPLRQHVRQRPHPRLRPRRPRGHPQAARPGPRARHHPHRPQVDFVDSLCSRPCGPISAPAACPSS